MKHHNNLNPTTPIDPAIDDLLHQAGVFARPQDVVDDVELTLDEKRARLSSWASDACAVDAAPAARRAPRSGRTVKVDELLDALCALDRLVRSPPATGGQYRVGAKHPTMDGETQDQPSVN